MSRSSTECVPLQSCTIPPGTVASYELAIRQFRQKLHRDLPATTVWGFGDAATNGVYPGPTVLASSGEPVTVTWINDLRDESGNLLTAHHLPVDNVLRK